MIYRCFRSRSDAGSSFRLLGTKGVAPADLALDVVIDFEPLSAHVVSLSHTVMFHPATGWCTMRVARRRCTDACRPR